VVHGEFQSLNIHFCSRRSASIYTLCGQLTTLGFAWLLQDFVRELSVTCAFAIAVLVVPELLALNNISRWVMCLFLYPMFNFSVDAKAMGSAFAPNVLYTLSALNEEQDDLFFRGPSLGRFVGSICGGVLAGKVMKRCFPDDPKES
jgi:hypothetical protein